MGTVFEAEHVRLGKAFAVKLIRPDEASRQSARARFREEVKALSKVSSQHVVSIVDCGEDDGTPYLVMERLVGSDLRAVLRKGPLSAGRALRIALDSARGLAEVHRAGLVHRDLKPANVFLCQDGDGDEVVKILDFGVARSHAGNGTRSGSIVGTIRYMAPEQLGDSRSVGPQTDVYALGAILYECLAGEPPHVGETVEEVMFSILNRDAKNLKRSRPELSQELCDLVSWTLARTPSARCRTAPELAAAIRSLPELRGRDEEPATTIDGTESGVRWQTTVPSASPWKARARLAAACLLFLAGGVVLGRSRQETSDQAAPLPSGVTQARVVEPAPPAPAPAPAPREAALPPAPSSAPAAPLPDRVASAVPARARSSPVTASRPLRARDAVPSPSQPQPAAAELKPLETQNPYVD